MRISNLHYDGRKRAFVALVDIDQNGTRLRFPCEVPGSASLGHSVITAHLADRAQRWALRVRN